MNEYKWLLKQVLNNGQLRDTRAGPTYSCFGTSVSFNLYNSFPAITVKKLQFESVAGELAGFLRAETDATKMGSGIWLKDAKRWSGGTDMGRVYGALWRDWDGIDQLSQVVEALEKNPTDRRHIVTAWNPAELDKGCLPPCHYAMQFYVSNGQELNCMFHMRSVDLVLGFPFDIASYALLTHIIAKQLGIEPGVVTATLGDYHIYANHLEAAHTMLSRSVYRPPALYLDRATSIDNFKPEMAELICYKHHDTVHAPLNVGD